MGTNKLLSIQHPRKSNSPAGTTVPCQTPAHPLVLVEKQHNFSYLLMSIFPALLPCCVSNLNRTTSRKQSLSDEVSPCKQRRKKATKDSLTPIEKNKKTKTSTNSCLGKENTPLSRRRNTGILFINYKTERRR